MGWLHDLYRKLPRGAKHRVRRGWFEFLSRLDSGDDLLFLNHGYADPNAPRRGLDLEPGDERYRYAIQLVHRIAADVDWKGLRGLEISCGRGGGSSYVQRYLGPDSMVGLDLTRGAIRFCERHYDVPGLSFRIGDALALPFPDASFDRILNVESSLLYGDFDGFLAEAHRVLAPDGMLLFGDYRHTPRMRKLRRQIERSSFEIAHEEDLTRNVVAAMEIEVDAKHELIARHAPRPLRRLFNRFAGNTGKGDDELTAFRDGERTFLRFVLRKRTDAHA